MSGLDLLYGLPFVGALLILLLGKQREQAQILTAMSAFLVTAAITPIVLLIAPSGALQAGVSLIAITTAAIAYAVLGIHVLRASRRGIARPPSFYALLLVLVGSVDAIAVAQSPVIFFGAWILLMFVVIKLLWYGDVIKHVTADQDERMKRDQDREDFYNL